MEWMDKMEGRYGKLGDAHLFPIAYLTGKSLRSAESGTDLGVVAGLDGEGIAFASNNGRLNPVGLGYYDVYDPKTGFKLNPEDARRAA